MNVDGDTSNNKCYYAITLYWPFVLKRKSAESPEWTKLTITQPKVLNEKPK